MTAAPKIELARFVPAVDDRWLLDEEDMPEAPLHDFALEALVLLLKAWVARAGRDASIHRTIAMRWTRSRPKTGADPDVCAVSPALPRDTTSLCLWNPGHAPPMLAIEVVSDSTASKDYLDNPARYAASGTMRSCAYKGRGRCAQGESINSGAGFTEPKPGVPAVSDGRTALERRSPTSCCAGCGIRTGCTAPSATTCRPIRPRTPGIVRRCWTPSVGAMAAPRKSRRTRGVP